MKKGLITGIILVVICIGLTVYYEIKSNNLTNIFEITNSGLKKENTKVYLDATFVAGSISNDDKNGYYVMFGNGVQYIVYMENNEAIKINEYLLNNPDSSYRIEGITKTIPENLEENGKKFVREWLDNNHHHEESENHSHEITTDEFYHYFGYVYLDNTVNNDVLLRIIIYLTGSVGAFIIVSFIIKKFRL